MNGSFDEHRRAVAPLSDQFKRAGHRLYLVGGVVRDELMGRQVETPDLDLTTDATPDQMKSLVDGIVEAVWLQGERFGTVGVRLEGRTIEITTHRAEAYTSDSRKPDVSYSTDLAADLVRRDFTVNAMAVDVVDGVLHDPHGGRSDLGAGLLRTPLDPEISFADLDYNIVIYLNLFSTITWQNYTLQNIPRQKGQSPGNPQQAFQISSGPA